MGSRADCTIEMLSNRIGTIESLLERIAASTIRNDNLRKEQQLTNEFSGLLHCGRNIDVLKSFDYCASDKPSLYNININDRECMLPDEQYPLDVEGPLHVLLRKAWGDDKFTDVRNKYIKGRDNGLLMSCDNLGLPTDGHVYINKYIYEAALKAKIPELVAVGKGGCIVRGRSNSTIQELLKIVIDISDTLGYAEDFVGQVELERVPAYEGLVTAIARNDPVDMQAEYDALSRHAKSQVRKYEFCQDCNIDF
jgi:hypothetical protein